MNITNHDKRVIKTAKVVHIKTYYNKGNKKYYYKRKYNYHVD